MPKLEATKSFTYATRRLLPGDSFDARTPRDARILIGIGKARAAPLVDPAHAALLAEAAKFGIQIDRRWGDKRIADEVEKAKAAAKAG